MSVPLLVAYDRAKQALLEQCVAIDGQPTHWYGELSTSALSTATAMMALWQVRAALEALPDRVDRARYEVDFDSLLQNGAAWLIAHQNDDGGWGDTTKSISNISTTMLCHAVLSLVIRHWSFVGIEESVGGAKNYIDRCGGVAAVRRRYGKDKTFSVPILTHCALAGLVDWREVSSLPFELACLPARFYAAVKLPVVSYALPALIAIGQVKHHFAPSWNPLIRWIRNRAIQKSLQVLERIQPPNGGFLEATPLTSFVTMSLAAKGLVEHVVVQRGVQFIVDSVRPDGSWPIDTNLATWVTTLAINALKDDVPVSLRLDLEQWLIQQQYRDLHPFTNAAPGGWAWTDLPGGVPDADDTPGAMLALMTLNQSAFTNPQRQQGTVNNLESQQHSVGPSPLTPLPGVPGRGEQDVARQPSAELASQCDLPATHREALDAATKWLVDLQNRDGGFPTFCRGWGTLPFDRSSPDITAHCLRAISKYRRLEETIGLALRGAKLRRDPSFPDAEFQACLNGFRFLKRRQRSDGAWLPLWFGNQHAHDDENPTYGTSRVLMAYRDCGLMETPEAQRGAAFLASIQNADGGWGGAAGMASSVEETALAAEVLLDVKIYRSHAFRGIDWLIARVWDGSFQEPSPIGFYFAKLWYFERLYPLIFAVSALRRAREILATAS